MVRLEVLAGTRTGVCFSSTSLPIRVGRAADDDLTLDEPGVWPSHFSIQREKNDLFIHVGPNALLSINGESVQQSPLRNGDIISLGAIKLQFGFAPVRQASLLWRERLTWVALAGLAFCEIAVAYLLW
jgi:pSer/pThr/pTyr-binding forkhead associated (FHA) protein